MNSSLPILQRMDRLEKLLQFLEEKHCLSSKHSSIRACESSELEQDCDAYKSTSSAIEEVKCKGTLIERVAMLESRFLQLSLEIALENASSSSCTTLNEEYESSNACVRKPKGLRKRRTRSTTIVSIVQSREWLRWPRMGC